MHMHAYLEGYQKDSTYIKLSSWCRIRTKNTQMTLAYINDIINHSAGKIIIVLSNCQFVW